MLIARALVLVCLPAAALAQAPAAPPSSHIPPAVVAELRRLNNQFALALAQDCAPERCFAKGCVYGEHVVVDKPRSMSLPGLMDAEGPGSVAPQEYLTQARCEFAHEKSVSTRDVQALVRRLTQKLSTGWLVVTVEPKVLEPISPSLRESPPEPQNKPEPPPQPEAPVPPPAPEPQEWDGKIALRELWLSLLPHFSWMIAVLLGTLAALTLIWAARRLGRESFEEKALLAKLARGEEPAAEASAPPTAAPAGPSEPAPEGAMPDGGEDVFVAEQERAWSQRFARVHEGEGDNVVQAVLRQWLREGELPLLAKAILLFGERLPLAFSDDGELAGRKIELAEYLRSVDPERLPSEREFFRTLNQHAAAASLLAQADAEALRSLQKEVGSAAMAQLIEALSPRHGALLYALAPLDCQHEVACSLRAELRVQVAEQLLASNRISKREAAYLLDVLRAVRDGAPVPALREAGLRDYGREIDAAGPLSVLLAHIEPAERGRLFAAARERSSGAFPHWYEEIVFGDMLLKLPAELRTDMLLEVDIRGLAGWLSMQEPAWQQQFLAQLSPSLKNAVHASLGFVSRADQVALAHQGREQLAAAVKRLVARGTVSFAQMVA